MQKKVEARVLVRRNSGDVKERLSSLSPSLSPSSYSNSLDGSTSLLSRWYGRGRRKNSRSYDPHSAEEGTQTYNGNWQSEVRVDVPPQDRVERVEKEATMEISN